MPQFQKGQSGNPNGRPKRKPITSELVKLLTVKPHGGSLTNAHLIASSLVDHAQVGNVAAARTILEYVEGKPVSQVEVEIWIMAARLAAARGVDPVELVRRAELIANGKA